MKYLHANISISAFQSPRHAHIGSAEWSGNFIKASIDVKNLIVTQIQARLNVGILKAMKINAGLEILQNVHLKCVLNIKIGNTAVKHGATKKKTMVSTVAQQRWNKNANGMESVQMLSVKEK